MCSLDIVKQYKEGLIMKILMMIKMREGMRQSGGGGGGDDEVWKLVNDEEE